MTAWVRPAALLPGQPYHAVRESTGEASRDKPFLLQFRGTAHPFEIRGGTLLSSDCHNPVGART